MMLGRAFSHNCSCTYRLHHTEMCRSVGRHHSNPNSGRSHLKLMRIWNRQSNLQIHSGSQLVLYEFCAVHHFILYNGAPCFDKFITIHTVIYLILQAQFSQESLDSPLLPSFVVCLCVYIRTK